MVKETLEDLAKTEPQPIPQSGKKVLNYSSNR
jgi:hypothetical protein